MESRRDAARALGQIRDVRAVEPLICLLMDNHSYVREAAKEALDEIDPDWASSEEAKRHVPELVSAFLRANDWGMRWDIAEVLGDIGDKRAVKALAWAIKHDNEYVQYTAKIALEKIKEAHGKD